MWASFQLKYWRARWTLQGMLLQRLVPPKLVGLHRPLRLLTYRRRNSHAFPQRSHSMERFKGRSTGNPWFGRPELPGFPTCWTDVSTTPGVDSASTVRSGRSRTSLCRSDDLDTALTLEGGRPADMDHLGVYPPNRSVWHHQFGIRMYSSPHRPCHPRQP